MKSMMTVCLFLAGFLVVTCAMAQLYNDKSEQLTKPMEIAITVANMTYANVAAAGDSENAKPQEQRYEEMTNAFNAPNQRHFDNASELQSKSR